MGTFLNRLFGYQPKAVDKRIEYKFNAVRAGHARNDERKWREQCAK